MKNIADFLFEAKMLKETPRSGYQFLGSGAESVAEHSFMITVIAWVMGRIEPEIDQHKIISMALFHDLAEARTGDLNYVNQKYSSTDEKKAVYDLTRNIFFGENIRQLIDEFNDAITKEAKLAKDADQLAFILELKKLLDTGRKGPEKWIPIVTKRLLTQTGKTIAKKINDTSWDNWWLERYAE